MPEADKSAGLWPAHRHEARTGRDELAVARDQPFRQKAGMSLPYRSVLAAAVLLAATLAHAKTLIYAGALIDGRADTARKAVTITIDGDRITGLADGYIAAAAGDTVIDLKHATVMPGLMDMHVHLDGQQSPTSYTEGFYLNPGDYALRAAFYAKKTLLAGFTTVRNVGDTNYSTVALRKAITAGWVDGPRVYTAGPAMGTTGSHADPTNGYSAQVMDLFPEPEIFNGADGARAAVREHVKRGADVIKIMTTGGVLSLGDTAQGAQMTLDEIKAVVETAHEYGLKVAVHAHGTEGMKRAVLGGVDSIEHGTFMTDEIVTLMKEHGTYYVPTLSAGNFVMEKAKIPGFLPPSVAAKAMLVGPAMTATFQRAYHAGVKIAFGTDQGVAPHGENAKEFIYMVDAGMTPMDAIKTSTLEASKLLGVDKDLGTVEAGKFADLVAVPGDPLADIKLLTNVTFVMKGGKVYKQ
jgi:imidazolonepropionase-like amidohydrolase